MRSPPEPCPRCGASVVEARAAADGPPRRACAYCGADRGPIGPPPVSPAAPGPFPPPAVLGPPPRPAPSRSSGVLRLVVGGFGSLTSLFLCLPLALLFSPRACSSTSASHGVALAELQACPRARAVLGENIDAAWVGLSSGSSREGGGYGSASWSLTVSGDRARGSFAFQAQQQAGRWRLVSGTLQVPGEAPVVLPRDCASGSEPRVGAGSTARPDPSAGGAAPGAGPCERLRACCDAVDDGSSQGVGQVCASVPMLALTPNPDRTCEQLLGSMTPLLRAEGQATPAVCEGR